MGFTKCQEKLVEVVRRSIASYQDFPKAGILFRDIFPVLRDPKVFDALITIMVEIIKSQAPNANVIAAIESRGFLFGPIIALKLELPFIPCRKSGKLPGPITSVEYDLEYGTDTLEMPANVVQSGSKVVIVDDLLATAGTMKAVCQMVNNVGGCVVLCLTIIELLELKGKEKLDVPFASIVQY